MQRRSFMQALAALAASRGVNLEDTDEEDPVDTLDYWVADVEPKVIRSSGGGVVAGWDIEGESLDELQVAAWYDSAGVALDLQGDGELVRTSTFAQLDPDEARELGVALFQAAEELDAWREADDVDG